jgi:hypothetical protein
MGCPDNCDMENLLYQACNADCITKGTYDAEVCYAQCEACFTTNGCWDDVDTYGATADQTCYNSCYSLCEEYWPTSSTLCDCDSHQKCVYGCPGNCTSSDYSITCNTDCLADGLQDVDTCYTQCKTCIDANCWVDAEYGDSSDRACWDDCYASCATLVGSGSDLCSCTGHN